MSRRLSKSVILLSALAMAAPALAQPPRVAPDQVPGYWRMVKHEVDVMVPNSGRNLDKPGCAAVSYMIGSDGVPQQVVARKVVPANSDFGKVGVSAVSNFRYAPSDSNDHDQPIDTYYIVRFNMPRDPAQRKALVAQCKLPGYPES